MNKTTAESAYATRAADVVFGIGWIGLFAYHHYVLNQFLVDIPFWDNWESLNDGALGEDLSLKWLLAPHNEHRILFTRLQNWVFYRGFDWDLALIQKVNFLMFGAILLVFGRICHTMFQGIPAWPWFLTFGFLLSPRIWENHYWAFQSQFHVTFFLLIVAAHGLFHPSQNRKRLTYGGLAAGVAGYCFSAAIAATIILMVVFMVYKVNRAVAGDRRREFGEGAAVSLPVFLAIAFWFFGREQPAHPPKVLPHDSRFWDYFFNLISSGWGVNDVDYRIGFAFLLVSAAPFVLLVMRRRAWTDDRFWFVVATTFGAMAWLGAIAIGRAGFNNVEFAKSSRYVELASVLIPTTALAWGLFFESRKEYFYGALAIIWVAAYVGYRDDWRFHETYSTQYGYRQAGYNCVEEFVRGKGDGACPTIYPRPLGARIQNANRLNVSFVQKMRE